MLKKLIFRRTKTIRTKSCKVNVKGATYYKCDSHTTPHEFMNEMKAHLKA